MGVQKRELSSEYNDLGKEIVDAAFKVHYELGPGLLEKIYEKCFCFELAQKGLSVKQQVSVPIIYKGLSLEGAFRMDILVNDRIICELKTVNTNTNIELWKAQLLTNMKLKNLKLGYLINFNVDKIKSGITRVILSA